MPYVVDIRCVQHNPCFATSYDLFPVGTNHKTSVFFGWLLNYFWMILVVRLSMNLYCHSCRQGHFVVLHLLMLLPKHSRHSSDDPIPSAHIPTV